VLVCSIHKRHVDKANQQKSNTSPCWKEEYSIIPSGTRAGCASWHSACRSSRPARYRAGVLQCQPDDVSRHQEEEDDASSRAANDTPQKRDCRPSPVQMNPKTASVPKAYSSRTYARKYRNVESFWDSRTLVTVLLCHIGRWVPDEMFRIWRSHY